MADPRRQLQGLKNRAHGKQFEDRIDTTLEYYKLRGFASIDKTPEPMRVIERLSGGRFIACFLKKAQPDYKGIIKGGREILLEAKYTDADRIEQSRVSQEQSDYMDEHQRLGARCYVIAGYSTGAVYRVPWDTWKNMKALYGRKYVTEADLKQYQVQTAYNDTLLLLT